MCVCHHCDVPNCIRPDHLFLGTKADNTADMIRKGRMKCGFDLPQTRFSKDQIAEIIRSDLPRRDIVRQYGISQSYLCMLKSGKQVRR